MILNLHMPLSLSFLVDFCVHLLQIPAPAYTEAPRDATAGNLL